VWGRELYLHTSLTDLARELGVSKAALYRHFRNKDAILDAMYGRYFDGHAAFIKDAYHRALEAADFAESTAIMTRIIVEYYLRNRDAFIFCLMRVYDNRKFEAAGDELRRRGVDMSRFRSRDEGAPEHPALFQMIITTLMFWTAIFHERGQPVRGVWTEKTPAEAEILAMIGVAEEKIMKGLGLSAEMLDALDYGALEARIPRSQLAAFEDDDLIKAVAETVAEAGPWDASLDMIARRSGLSKSGLYAHFKSRQDMLRSFFMIEFERMIRYAGAAAAASDSPAEQFYLVLASLTDYLRSRPEILMAVDWLKTRRLDLGLEVPDRLYRIFSDIKLPGAGAAPAEGTEPEHIPQWILFLIINTLMYRPPGAGSLGVSNAAVRRLYRFICRGLGGFET
jgi:AcrR family transcriptional regulator